MATTRAAVNKALEKAGYPNVTLHKGKGYYYFVGPDTDRWYTASVAVWSIHEMTVTEWVRHYGQMRLANAWPVE